MATYSEFQICTDNPNLIPEFIEKGEFTFNKVIPMPDDLEIESGSNTDRGIAYFLTERLTKTAAEANLAQYISNMFDEDWAGTVVMRLQDCNMDDEEADKLYELGRQCVYNLEHHGAYDWYFWRTQNWGSKWDAVETIFEPEKPGEVSFLAVGYPAPVFEEICRRYPDTKITFTVYYSDGIECYENQNGNFVRLSHFN